MEVFEGVDDIEEVALSTATVCGGAYGGGLGEGLKVEGGDSSEDIEGRGLGAIEAAGLADLSDCDFCEYVSEFRGGMCLR